MDGYYNNWNFPYEAAKETIFALDKAKVDIIEVGYRSPIKDPKMGLFKFTNEEYLEYLSLLTHAECAFMIDVKEYVASKNQLDIPLLNEHVLPQAKSLFKWVRLATHITTVNETALMVNWFAEQGYKVCVNLMGCSLLSDNEIIAALAQMDADKIEYFYFADSFGSFYKEDVHRLVDLISTKYDGKLGIHTHDNQGMALSNTLEAIDRDVQIVDGTLTGMGRGAGNLMTEQFLLCAKHKLNLDFGSLEGVNTIIQDYYDPMKNEHKWGFSKHYMLSGLWDIHPTYVQRLMAANRFTSEEINQILNFISDRNTKKFDSETLDLAIKSLLDNKQNKGEDLQGCEIKPFKSCLIAANPNYLKTKQEELKLFVQQNEGMELLECNPTGLFKDNSRYLVALNKSKLDRIVDVGNIKKIITGQDKSANKVILKQCCYQPFEIGSPSINTEGEICIPDYDAGMYAILWAIQSGAKKIAIAGFTGHDSSTENSKMDQFFADLNIAFPEILIQSVSPTSYKNVNQQSLYSKF